MSVRDELYEYINENFLYLQPDLELTDEDRFLELGVIDSTGVVELVGEVEERYGITVEDNEITEENFGSLAGLVPLRREQAPRGGLVRWLSARSTTICARPPRARPTRPRSSPAIGASATASSTAWPTASPVA